MCVCVSVCLSVYARVCAPGGLIPFRAFQSSVWEHRPGREENLCENNPCECDKNLCECEKNPGECETNPGECDKNPGGCEKDPGAKNMFPAAGHRR